MPVPRAVVVAVAAGVAVYGLVWAVQRVARALPQRYRV